MNSHQCAYSANALFLIKLTNTLSEHFTEEHVNQIGLLDLVRKVKRTYPEKDIWAYSGFLFDRDIVGKQCDIFMPSIIQDIHREMLKQKVNEYKNEEIQCAIKKIT